ncbi:Cof-type HAD-IIB family hydrolase [Radiobacillus kanasensis]|uniref:Cof-type HAD-IIB family hydrolase n=1 Tax=Radiobacillus kanasensis TaxID=2844358 RepID=UPI001E470802|nr:Cof-type HAD-IIB family hydrolase [Radiobacillus kanasensis]UFT99994.1 Cof-type HAD-IIB family hydrolase [Radiobacillus kanasensis]
MAIKLIALDMDGTLLNKDNQVSEQNKSAIAKARELGVEVVLSTGRHISTCKPIADELLLSSYLITVNGSEIWTTEGELVERQPLGLESIKRLIELHKEHQTGLWMTSTEQVWREEIPDQLEEILWLKFGFNLKDETHRDLIWKELEKDPQFELSNSSPTNIEVNAIGINKATALEKVCNRLGITLEEVMTVGDSLNDIKMIKEAGLGIAMENAQPAVKKAADWVTGHHDQSGVAQAIEKWVLQ